MVFPLYRGYSTVAVSGVKTNITNIELVKQDLLNEFNTRFGERVGRPSFGSIIHDLLFDVFDDRTEGLAISDAERIFNNDPRVRLLEITSSVDAETHEITIESRLLFVEFDMEQNFNVTFRER